MMTRATWVALLAFATACSDPAAEHEYAERSAYTRALAVRDGVGDAWTLYGRDDLDFPHGFGPVEYHWYGEAGPGHGVASAQLPATAAARLRFRRGAGRHLELTGNVVDRLRSSRPTLQLVVDGRAIAESTIDATGRFELRTPALTGDAWVAADLRITMARAAAPATVVAMLDRVSWQP